MNVNLTTDMTSPSSIPYFLWDEPMTVAELKDKLATSSDDVRYRLLGKILREARDTDVWNFISPQELVVIWDKVEPYLGRRRPFWEFLIGKWQELGLID
ncbi:MAG TPA: hypothetical protein PKA82_09170 [Pyrinomonadaceae bacterium]|nr:hypothetical protein [Pyrinomonadaceae bacterium]